jgi:alkanesulfonate monooxygenase SsuD/methylene tetrahydromethanopterin reductase-like flavin-dependent oxidoreductase (luciferase family)
MADHGVAFKDRWKVTRERVLAMKEIWIHDIAEYHGKFVDFDPMWCRPKPIQKGGPPVLLGAQSKWALARVAQYCDGWIPLDRGSRFAAQLDTIRLEMANAGRAAQNLNLSVLTDLPPGRGLEQRFRELEKLGFNRIVFMIPIVPAEKQRRIIDTYAKMMSGLEV